MTPLRLISALAVALALSTAAAVSGDTGNVGDERISRAEIFLDTGRPDRAAVILYDVLEDDLDDGERIRALYVLSESMKALGRPAEQARYLNEAIALDPAAGYADDVRVAYARFELDNGRNRECIDLAGEFYRDYSESPRMPDMLAIEADAWFREGEHLRSFNTLSDIIAQYPDSEPAREAVMKQGLCLYHLNLISGAIERLEEYRTESPGGANIPEAMFHLGVCYELSNRSDMAVPAFRRVTLSHPSYDRVLEAFFRLGRACFDTGRYAEAENAFMNYVANTPQSDPEHDESLFYLERIKYRTGEYVSELQIAERFAEQYPDSPRTPGLLFDLARYHRVVGDSGNAIAVYRKIMSDSLYAAYSDSAACMIAETYDDAGEYENAKSFLLDTAHESRNPDTAGAMFLRLGLLSERRVQYDAAIAWYDSVLATGASPAVMFEALTGIGRAFSGLKRWYQAAQTYERIIEEYPHDQNIGETHAALAEVYYTQGRIRDAARIAERGVAHLEGQRKTALQFRVADLYEQIDDRRAMQLYYSLSADEETPANQRTRALLQYGDLALSLGDSIEAHYAYRMVIAGGADSTAVRKAQEALQHLGRREEYFTE